MESAWFLLSKSSDHRVSAASEVSEVNTHLFIRMLRSVGLAGYEPMCPQTDVPTH